MKRILAVSFLVAVLLAALRAGEAAQLPDDAALRSWVQAMKEAPRGPFARLRWFCNDGTILPPKEYACREHGGGVQHGEWTDRVKLMRDNGYYIANVYADIDPATFQENPEHLEIVKQMILERFLMDADSGWIFRKARYYRGALQTEDENRGGRGLLLALAKNPQWTQQLFVVLREAMRFLPHGRKNTSVTEMRQLSLSLAEQDPNFETLRIKIHVHPELSDAEAVRSYAKTRGVAELSQEYERLAAIIDAVYRPQDIGPALASLAKLIKNTELRRQLDKAAGQLDDPLDPAQRFAVAGRLLATLRDSLAKTGQASRRLALLQTGLVLESELYRSGNELLEKLPAASRRRRLLWLADCGEGLYGSALISARQHRALQETFQTLLKAHPRLIDYQAGLVYAARVPEWADRLLRFHFSEAVARLGVIEPLSLRYIHDRLRGSLLLLYAAVLESLMADADRQLGIENEVFGQKTAAGLRGLNAGLARGILRVSESGADMHGSDRNGIYVLPATIEDLPPVAGIITAGKGNILSHVQLLARNLGLPNVAVDKKLLPSITARKGHKTVLAVSALGIVQLVADGPGWDPVFAQESNVQNIDIRPDLDKLDLSNLDFIPLQEMRATDSGRIAGPKAANLGELKHHFPAAVTDGLVIPFGHFRALLDQKLEPGGPSVFSWMQQQNALIQGLKEDPAQQAQVTRGFLQRMRDWIENADPGEAFGRRLRQAMEARFGPDGSYGVFVRSDTNVEDLPGFSGAGLNLTVVNVVGAENVFEAIRRVWASPFTERAYSWRQAYMQNPEHVYVSVLLLKSIPVDKSGVMVTADVDTGQTGWLTIAANEGIGGAVSGQASEELRIHPASGKVRLMAQATEPHKRTLLKEGGMARVAAGGTEAVLSANDIAQLIEFARSVPERFPRLQNADASTVPADIEFGFFKDRLVLFQIRPFLESTRARKNLYLNRLDQRLREKYAVVIDLDEIPAEEGQ